MARAKAAARKPKADKAAKPKKAAGPKKSKVTSMYNLVFFIIMCQWLNKDNMSCIYIFNRQGTVYHYRHSILARLL